MALSKTQILSKLKSAGHTVYALNNTVFYIPTKDRKTTIQGVLGLFARDGAVPNRKSLHSAIGSVSVGNYTIVVTRMKYNPQPIRNVNGNPSVQNRLKFGAMIQDVIANSLKPINICFSGHKKITIKNVLGTQFLGKGVADFVLITKPSKQVPVSVHLIDGTYHEDVHGRYDDYAYAALEKVVESGDIEADMDGDTITLYAPIAFPCDTRAIRELIFRDINTGIGVTGNFAPDDMSYDGKTNTLTVKCHRVFQTPTDFKSTDKPFFAIVNQKDGKIGDLKGIAMDVVPKSALPRDVILTEL